MLDHTLNLRQIIKQIEPVVYAAGSAIVRDFRYDFWQQAKPAGDFVTAADLASQQILQTGLTQILAGQIISEETVNQYQSWDYAWVIDPLDGTNNFRRGLPHFCISIALVRAQCTILGVIYDPLQQDLFYAILGQGAYWVDRTGVCRQMQLDLNRQKLTNNELRKFSDYVLAGNLDKIYTLMPGAMLRRQGSAALDLAYVAQGWIDLTGYTGLYWWDIAAGSLLITEAGYSQSILEQNLYQGQAQTLFLAGSAGLVKAILQQQDKLI